jgi:hypothetical protein
MTNYESDNKRDGKSIAGAAAGWGIAISLSIIFILIHKLLLMFQYYLHNADDIGEGLGTNDFYSARLYFIQTKLAFSTTMLIYRLANSECFSKNINMYSIDKYKSSWINVVISP